MKDEQLNKSSYMGRTMVLWVVLTMFKFDVDVCRNLNFPYLCLYYDKSN